MNYENTIYTEYTIQKYSTYMNIVMRYYYYKIKMHLYTIIIVNQIFDYKHFHGLLRGTSNCMM